MLSSDTEEKFQIVSNINTASTSYQNNPYHLSNVNHGYDENNRASRTSSSFADTTQSNVAKNTDYYFYLRRIYSFWYEYLPGLYRNYQDRTGRASTEQDRYSEGTSILSFQKKLDLLIFLFFKANPKYKHAFFSMLTLVCLLLAILGICVYILKKNNKSLASASTIL